MDSVPPRKAQPLRQNTGEAGSAEERQSSERQQDKTSLTLPDLTVSDLTISDLRADLANASSEPLALIVEKLCSDG